MCVCSEAAAHAVATLAEATLQGGGQIVLAETAAAVGALAGVQDATGTSSIHGCENTQNTCKYTQFRKFPRLFYSFLILSCSAIIGISD